MNIQDIMKEVTEKMEQTRQKTQEHLDRIQVSISSKSLENIKVNIYETLLPIKNIARFNKIDSQTISIEPFDKTHAAAIESGITRSKQDFSVRRKGNTGSVYVTLPPLTEERRKKHVGEVHEQEEKEKVLIRNQRTHAKKELKNLPKEGISEDEIKKAEDKLQKITDKYIKGIEELCRKKKENLLTI
ncbi:MAG: ribosome-recycling factor [Bacteroidota bacterium]